MARKSPRSNQSKNASRRSQRAASPAEKSARKAGGRPPSPRRRASHRRAHAPRHHGRRVRHLGRRAVHARPSCPPSAVVTVVRLAALHLTFGLGAYLLPFFLLAIGGVSFLVRFDRERVPRARRGGPRPHTRGAARLLALFTPLATGEEGARWRSSTPHQLSVRGGYVGAALAWVGFTLFGQVISAIIMYRRHRRRLRRHRVLPLELIEKVHATRRLGRRGCRPAYARA